MVSGNEDLLSQRRFGVLLHVTSLPGRRPQIGEPARRFVDWLASTGAAFWQVLPLSPPGGVEHIVPYASWATLAGDPRLIDLDDLVGEGVLSPSDLEVARGDGDGRTVLGRPPVLAAILRRLGQRARQFDAWRSDLELFQASAGWASEVGLFVGLKREHEGLPWWDWPPELRDREPAALREARVRHAETIRQEVALQFVFERQWARLRDYARRRGVRILGDVPIYVVPDSVDVWGAPQGWRMRRDGTILAFTGAPPDEMSPEGQFWGAPPYDWDAMARDDFDWWTRRLRRATDHADVIRLDHFRAFSAHWEIPAETGHARDGRWLPGPGRRLFDAVKRKLNGLPALCVEDLGGIDDNVRSLRDGLGLAGMRVLHYGFGNGEHNPHLPHNHPSRCIVYPGNHDNDTTLGWWGRLDPGTRSHVQHYLGRHGDDIVWDLNRAALSSVGSLAVLQMQDILGLGSEARMNDPASYSRPVHERRNWMWRLSESQLDSCTAERVRFLARMYGRLP